MPQTISSSLPPFRFEVFFRVAAILALVLFLVAGAMLSIRHESGVVFPDEQEYYLLAEKLVQHHFLTWDGVQPTAARPPGFVLWLSIWKALGVGWSGMVFLNFLIVTGGLWALIDAWFPRERRWAARAAIFGLLFCYPVTIYVFSTLYPQAFCLALLTVSLALMLRASGWLAGALAGLLMGWCALSAPMYLTWAGIFGLVPLLRYRLSGLPSALVFAAMFCLVIGGWGARNAVVMGKFVPFSTNSGHNLLAGNCENTRPNAGLTIDLTRWDDAVKNRKLGELEADAFYTQAAKDWIRENPLRAASMYVQKLLNYFNYRNDLVVKSAGSASRDLVMFVTYYALLALVIIRVFGWPERVDARGWLLLAGLVACAMFTSLVTTRIRYRIPCDVLLFFVAAPVVFAAVEGMLKRFASRSR